MLTKLLVTLFVFSISVCVNSSPIATDCVASLEISNGVASKQNLCADIDSKETTAAQHQSYSGVRENEVVAHVRLSKRQPSFAESLMAMFFIPGLILLWFSRFTKSSK